MTYLPVSVAVTPSLVATTREPVAIEVVLATQFVDRAVEGMVELVVPPGWSVTPPRRPYRIAREAPVEFTAIVTPPADAVPDLYFVAARIRCDDQTVEDVATIALRCGGGLSGVLPVPGAVPDQATVVRGSTADTGRPTGLTVTQSTTDLRLPPAGRGSLAVTLTNDTGAEIRGEAQLVSPWGSWEWLPEAVTGFTVPAAATRQLDFPVVIPDDAQPGHAWALVKVMWFGRVQYAPTVRLEVTA
jgi:hypothetical protein